jgi:tetratricopeptide (TPR) repeat protein
MSFPIRMMAYVAGFGGDKDKGIRMVEDAASSRGSVAADARFALVLLYNRERRFSEALRVLSELRAEFPRNRILWLESGATALRGGKLDEAERLLSEGLTRLATDGRPRMHGEEALWMLKRGATRVALNRLPDAEADLTRGSTLEARPWVTGRIHAELGKVADLRQDRATARRHFQRALALAQQGNDPPGADAARRWVNTAWGNSAVRRER